MENPQEVLTERPQKSNIWAETVDFFKRTLTGER